MAYVSAHTPFALPPSCSSPCVLRVHSGQKPTFSSDGLWLKPIGWSTGRIHFLNPLRSANTSAHNRALRIRSPYWVLSRKSTSILNDALPPDIFTLMD